MSGFHFNTNRHGRTQYLIFKAVEDVMDGKTVVYAALDEQHAKEIVTRIKHVAHLMHVLGKFEIKVTKSGCHLKKL
jgi:hypothetical protein